MSKRPKKMDLNQLAKRIVDEAIGEDELCQKELTSKKAGSRKGGLKGGKTRMSQLNNEQRKELAKKAAEARWGNAAPSIETDAAKLTSKP